MEREEGELTDEDLEDVSDNSSLSMIPIPMLLSGKSPSLSANREPFRELSLTSVSDDSEDRELKYRIISTRSRDINHEICRKHRCRREEKKHSGIKRVRKESERRVVRRRTSSLHKEYSSVSSSSDESDYYKQDKVILRQLRDAVRINRSQNLPNCSLRSRLKRMIEPDSQGSKNSNSEDENDLDTLRDLALQSKSKKESDTPNVTDKDLIELRLIALQSAVIKKHQNRRKNKEELLKKIESEVNVENNVENEQNMEIDSLIKENVNENNDNLESKQERIHNTSDINSTEATNNINDNPKTNVVEDEVILRAVLLSSISNQDNINTAEENSNAKTVTEKSGDKEEEAILRAMLMSSIYNTNTDSPQSNQENIQNNVDSNSNTCTTTEKTENTKSNIEEDEDILRAMLLANISKKIASKRTAKQTNNVLSRNNTNVNRANVIVSKTVTNSSYKSTIKVPSVPVNRFIINLNSDSDSDCDQTMIEKRKPEKAAKKNDIFDKSLSLFLQQARAKSDAEHKSDISHLPKSQQLEYIRLKRKLQQLTRSRLKTTAKTKKILVTPDENNKFQLVNVNTKKDKSVINQEPKTALKSIPDEKQLNSKIDRLQVKGKYEELGPLMTKVSDARVARDKAQIEVKRLINELRVARAELTSTHQTYTNLMQQLVKEKSLIDKRSDDQELEIKILNNNPPIWTSTPNKVNLKENSRDISCELSAINESVQSKDDPVEVKKDKTVVPEIEDMEIEDTPTEEEKKESTIWKYSSPLDHIQLNREQPYSNPLMILCPYDLLGVCRDPDCSFRHCGNAITD